MEFMRAKTSVMYDMTPIQSPDASGIYKSKNWYFDQCMITQSENDPMVVGRSKAQAEAGAGLVFFHRYLRGGVRGVAGMTNIDREPGQMYLFDQASMVSCIQLKVKAQGIYFPKSLLGYHPDKHAPIVRFSEYGAIGVLLFQQFDLLMQRLNQSDTVDKAHFENLKATIKIVLGTDNQHGDVRRRARNAMAGLIREHIEQHLDQSDLTTSKLLNTFGVSRASLFRMFEADGGVRHFVQKRRLYRAVLDLARNAGSRGAVTAAADRWGFSSGSNFNRAVKQTFGVAPGSLVDISNREIHDLSAADDIHAFVRRTQLSAA